MSGSQRGVTNDRRTITHRGSELDPSNVNRKQNVTGQETPILEWTGPRKYSRIEYAAGVHPTFAELRAMEEVAGISSETQTLSTNFVPIDGEPDLDDQPFEAVVAVDVTAGSKVALSDIDYIDNTVTIDSADYTGGNDYKFYPVIADGHVKYRGIDQMNHDIGSLDKWGTPLVAFSDHDQKKADSRIHLLGSAAWGEEETIAVNIESPDQVVWEDADWPGAYVSEFRQRVDVTV